MSLSREDAIALARKHCRDFIPTDWIIAAIMEAATAVPREPTEEMLDAALGAKDGYPIYHDFKKYDRDNDYRRVWRAMYDAAVATPTAAPDDAGLSWRGHNIHGDAASIDAVKHALHLADQVEEWQAVFRVKAVPAPAAPLGAEDADLLRMLRAYPTDDWQIVAATRIEQLSAQVRMLEATRDLLKP